ncbi:uncharacterized protein RSE6_07067 [Rhynchosporium secalis]|uniref:Uncharacterized protein n=1 Tax=Rhynchosporium secalis TaxID=38038 RepID=A0A1E1MC59_RHYSE|nr:uncharacterized protein RSE6_07067 [Rhynchosporium secalis]
MGDFVFEEAVLGTFIKLTNITSWSHSQSFDMNLSTFISPGKVTLRRSRIRSTSADAFISGTKREVNTEHLASVNPSEVRS